MVNNNPGMDNQPLVGSLKEVRSLRVLKTFFGMETGNRQRNWLAFNRQFERNKGCKSLRRDGRYYIYVQSIKLASKLPIRIIVQQENYHV